MERGIDLIVACLISAIGYFVFKLPQVYEALGSGSIVGCALVPLFATLYFQLRILFKMPDPSDLREFGRAMEEDLPDWDVLGKDMARDRVRQEIREIEEVRKPGNFLFFLFLNWLMVACVALVPYFVIWFVLGMAGIDIPQVSLN